MRISLAARASVGAMLFCSLGLAQVATLTGRITDPTGAVVPQAAVVATQTDTGVTSSTETNSEGYYSLPSLPPGKYELTINKAGFQPLKQSGLELAVQQVARLDLTLKLGQTGETIEVRATAQLLESESTTVGQVIGNRQVTELPLLGRNSYALATLSPGVRGAVGVNNLVVDQISTTAYSINGQRGNSNEFLLDGAPNSAPAQNQPVINANPDMVQEFKVETNNFSAEYGRAAGGVFNVVTRSGTNELHASAYEFLRNDKINANDFFANRSGLGKAPFRFNQFGGTIGGPVVIPKVYNGKNKTFFFANTELVRFIQGVTFTATLPDPRMLTGDFSNTRLSDGRLVTIYDPATTTSTGTGFTRQAFPGNIIPANRINPVARSISKLFPTPTVANAPLGVNNYTRNDGNVIEKNSWSVRGDHHFNDRNRMFVRYTYDDTPWNRAPVYGQEFNLSSPTAGPQSFTRFNASAEDTHTFTPTLLGTFRYSISRLTNFRRPRSDGFDIESVGLPAYLRAGMVDPISLPAITITGYGANSSVSNTIVGGLIGATDLIRFGGATQSFQGNLTKVLSSHTVKVGGEFRLVQFNNQQTGDQATNFSFAPTWTQGPNPTASSATAGLGLATFLLGIPGGGVAPAPALALTNKYYGLFIQDSWKLGNKLTINWGLRYDYETPRTDRFNQLANFDYNASSPLKAAGIDPKGGLTYVGVNGNSRYQWNPDRNNFAPRLGIAYRMTPKTVIRTGAGIFYAGVTGIGGGTGPFGLAGFQATTSVQTSLDGVTPIVDLSNPYPNGFNKPTGSSAGLSTLLGQSIQFVDRGNVTPYSAQWNFNIQQELPGAVAFEVGYVGTRGLHQMENLGGLNQLPDSALALGDQLRTQVANPFFGQVAVGVLANRTVARAQLLRPYPQFDGVSSQVASWASSTYHSLQARMEKRYASGLTVSGNYTYSKLMDYGTGPFGGETLGGGNFQNNNNRNAEWAVSTLDQTHRITANAVYELPFFNKSKGFARTALGGWQLGVIWSAYSGGPLGITSATNNTFSQGGGQRPNWNGQNPCVDNPTPQRWLDSSVFSVPAPYQFGNAPRTFGGCRSDGISNIDMTATKNTRFGERFNVQFRAEAFNLTNTPRFNPPNVAFGNPQFGIVNAQQNQPRILQFGLKLIF